MGYKAANRDKPLTRPLGRRQRDVLDFIQGEIRASRPSPTLREVAAAIGRKSTATACYHVNALERKGYVLRVRAKRYSKQRTIVLTQKAVDLYATRDERPAIPLPTPEPVAE